MNGGVSVMQPSCYASATPGKNAEATHFFTIHTKMKLAGHIGKEWGKLSSMVTFTHAYITHTHRHRYTHTDIYVW